MSFSYCLYGLYFSTEWALKQVAEHPGNKQRFHISLGCSAFGENLEHFDWQITQSPTGPDSGTKIWHCRDWLKLEFHRSRDEFLRFYIHKPSSGVFCDKTEQLPLSDIESFLLGPVMGCLLRLHQTACLHASALSLPQGTIALIGDKGQGKSTTAAALLDAGASLIADDIAALFWQQQQPWIHPGYPAVRLTERAMLANQLDPNHYAQVLSVGDKRYIPLASPGQELANGWRFCNKPKALKAIYLLGERLDSQQTTTISTLSPAQALISLAPHGYASRILDASGRQNEFANMARLTRQVGVKKLNCPNNLQKLPEVAEAIMADLQQTELNDISHHQARIAHGLPG